MAPCQGYVQKCYYTYNSLHLSNSSCVPDTILNALHGLSNLHLTTTLGGGFFYSLFIGGKMRHGEVPHLDLRVQCQNLSI